MSASRTQEKPKGNDDPATQDPPTPPTQEPPADGPETHIGEHTESPKTKKACNVGDCVRKATVRGLCDAHWASRRGDADPKTPEDRDE